MDWKTSQFAYVVLAVAGGVAKHVNEYLQTRQFHWGRIVGGAIVGGFSGYVFSQVAQQLAPAWANVVAGVGGYLGGEAIDFLTAMLKRRFKSVIEPDD